MTSLKSKQQGFTIVELLIVIVVIGILAALVITTFTGIQQKGRNTKRQTDINTLHSHLEAYYAQNSKYPTFGDMNSQSFRTANLKGLDPATFRDPKTAQTDDGNFELVAAPASGDYAYQPTKDDNSSCDNSSGNECTKYILTATNESNPASTYVKKSL